MNNDNIITLYIILGIIELIYLSYSDIHIKKIDQRYNYYMYGVTTILIYISHPKILYLSTIIFSSIITGLILRRKMGEGDIQIIGWMILGIGVIHYIYLILFFLNLVILLLLSQYIQKILHLNRKIPGLPILLSSYILTSYNILYQIIS